MTGRWLLVRETRDAYFDVPPISRTWLSGRRCVKHLPQRSNCLRNRAKRGSRNESLPGMQMRRCICSRPQHLAHPRYRSLKAPLHEPSRQPEHAVAQPCERPIPTPIALSATSVSAAIDFDDESHFRREEVDHKELPVGLAEHHLPAKGHTELRALQPRSQ